MTALRTALGILCTLCVASAAETGNISAKTAAPATVTVAKQDSAKPVEKPTSVKRSSVKPVDLALSRHTSSFNGPPGPTLAVGARYVISPTAGLSRLANFGQISEGEFIYDWPPGAKIVGAAPAVITPAVAPPTQAARR